MKDQDKTKKQLVAELTELRQRVAELEVSETERKQVAEKLRFQANALDWVRDAVIAIDDEQRVTYLNQAAAEQYGVNSEDALGCKLTELVQYDWLKPEHEQAAYTSLAEEGYRSGENIHIKKKGDRVYVESAVSVLQDDSGQDVGMLAVIRDITKRKRTEKEHEWLLGQATEARADLEEVATALERERDVLQTIMESTHAQLAYFDPQFNFVRVNSAYAQGSGYSKKELIGRNHFELFPHAENQAIFERVGGTGEPVLFHAKPFEFPKRPELGTTYWDWALVPVKDRHGKVKGLVLSLLDVTKHARATQVTVSLRSQPKEVELRIRDDGRGFDPDRVRPGRLGLGILRERAEAIGATLQITSQTDQGTEIVVIWSGP